MNFTHRSTEVSYFRAANSFFKIITHVPTKNTFKNQEKINGMNLLIFFKGEKLLFFFNQMTFMIMFSYFDGLLRQMRSRFLFSKECKNFQEKRK